MDERTNEGGGDANRRREGEEMNAVAMRNGVCRRLFSANREHGRALIKELSPLRVLPEFFPVKVLIFSDATACPRE